MRFIVVSEFERPNETPSAEPEPPELGFAPRADDMQEDRPDIYEFIGTYPNEDARLLLDAFGSEDIHFTLDVNKMGIEDMSAFQAANGGTFGAGVGIAIGVHVDDCDEAMAIRQRVLKIVL